MVYIKEWLPNPAGQDVGEWIKLGNDGGEAINLAGWRILTGAGKSTTLRGTIPAAGDLLLQKSDFKFVLRNTDENITLLNPLGKIMDQSSFRGTAPEGKIVGRAGIEASLIYEPHPFNAPLNSETSMSKAAMSGAALAIFLALIVSIIFKEHETLSELFGGEY